MELEDQREATKSSLTRGGTKDGREEPGYRSVPLTLCFSGTSRKLSTTFLSPTE